MQSRDDAVAAYSLNKLGILYHDQGRYADAEPLFKRSLAIAEKALGPDHPDVAKISMNLGIVYRDQRRYADAEPLFKRSLTLREKALGPDHPDVAVLLSELGGLYRVQGRYADAEPLFKRSLTIREKALGPDHRDVAVLLSELGDLYRDQRRYADAEPLYKRSLTIVEKALGPDHRDVAVALSELGVLYRDQGRYADAEPLYKRSLTIVEKALGPDHRDVAASLSELGGLYRIQGRYAEAEPQFKRLLMIREKALGPDHRDVAASLSELGVLYRVQGRYAEAEPLFKRSLMIREKALGPDHRDVAASLNELGGLYRVQGRYADAEPLFKRSLTIREKALGPDHRDVAVSLSELGVLYRVQRRYADAEPLYKRSLTIREKAFGPDHPHVAVSLNELGVLYRVQRRYADAEPLFKRSLAIVEKALGPDHPEVATASMVLGVIYRDQKRFADAELLYKQSLAIQENALGPDNPRVASSLNNLGNLYSQQGRHADAEQMLKRSLTIREKALGPDHPDVLPMLSNLGGLYRDQGRYADAEPLYKRSLAIVEKAFGPDHAEVASSLKGLIQLYQDQGRFEDALPLAKRIVKSGQATSSVIPVLFDAYRQGAISSEEFFDDGLKVAQRINQLSIAAAVDKLSVRLAAGNDRLAQLVRKDQDLAGEAEVLDESIISALSKEPASRDMASEQRIRDRIAVIAGERTSLQQTFSTEFPDYATLSKPEPLTTKQIRALLADDEALVIFAAGGDSYSFVFALTRDDRFKLTSIPLGGETLSKKVAAFRQGLDVRGSGRGYEVAAEADDNGAPGAGEFDLGLANELYQSLLGPVESLIKDKKQLLVVPAGSLSGLPFHLLVTEKPAAAVPDKLDGYRDAAWLIKWQAVSVLPSVASLKVLRTLGQKNQAAKPLVGFGDPVFNPNADPAPSSRGSTKLATRSLTTRAYSEFWKGSAIDRDQLAQSLDQLPDTAIELKSIAQKLGAPTSDIHFSRDASETTVKQTPLSDYRIVYFATHALVAGDVKDVAEPALALSLPATPTELDDGLLTASEVAQLKLNADWVVLSACNTIAGDKPGAEALSGLARAFFYAGARALLVSHWAVKTTAATRLTTSTFDILKANPKLGRAEALRQAMLAYLNDRSSPRNAHPAIWGPFAVIGEGGTAQ